MGLLAIQGLGLSEVGKIFVVSKDLDRKGGAVKIVSKGFESANNGEEFAVIDVVVSFCL